MKELAIATAIVLAHIALFCFTMWVLALGWVVVLAAIWCIFAIATVETNRFR